MDYTEFIEWGRVFELEYTKYDKTDYQLAQIAMYCHMPNSDKKSFKLNEYLIEFKKTEKNTEKVSPKTLINILQAAFGVEKKD
jgi:hypothetical protein